MANIDIQKKEGPPILPILLGVLAVAAVIVAVWLFTRNDDDSTTAAPGTMPYDTMQTTMATPPADEATPAEVRAFRERCADASQFRDEMGVAHQHAADCMRQLADGIDAVVRRETVADQPLQQRLESLRQRAGQITEDPQATDHANRVRGAADEAARIIEYIAQNRSTAGANLQQHAQQTRAAADRIDSDTLLLEQRDRTSAFFSRAADALDAMARQGHTQNQPR
jgi:hypothetical protein